MTLGGIMKQDVELFNPYGFQLISAKICGEDGRFLRGAKSADKSLYWGSRNCAIRQESHQNSFITSETNVRSSASRRLRAEKVCTEYRKQKFSSAFLSTVGRKTESNYCN